MSRYIRHCVANLKTSGPLTRSHITSNNVPTSPPRHVEHRANGAAPEGATFGTVFDVTWDRVWHGVRRGAAPEVPGLGPIGESTTCHSIATANSTRSQIYDVSRCSPVNRNAK